ncbi:MAG TPA: hypothetical protein GXZ90_05885, partial [Clostridiales bacterium]|nr:hypothetical protein [Clostridiales bacterium]
YFNINLSSGNLIKSIYGLVDSDSFSYIPLVGWSVMLMKSVVNLNVLNFIISFALYLLFIIGLIPIMLSKDGDYYEDVLVSTEKTHEAIESLKAKGSFNNAKNVNINTIKNIKVRDNILGINKGSGAWTIFYKQILEMKRTSRFAWIDSYIILTSVSIVALCYFLDFKYISYIIWGALIYFQLILSIITGLNFELSTHYTFLIPDKSYKKLIAILSKPILKAALDASIFFFILVVLGRETIITSIFLIVAYIVMILLYQSIIVLYQRVFNAQPNKFIQFIVTSIIFMIIFVPIIIATVIFVIALPSSLIYLSSLPLIIIGFLVSAIILTTCRNLFDKMEYTK